ncbi:hypothetical protein AURDEDRAFT_186585 [Auricularia subglabra TFB-10046 SS5]|uniref:Glycoside hydrolase family 44 catalytic domain-containing protein n=1 Tax=Auricularia subglabra (strain TFB-10046 / SS5) TaxID=717982 RepID=J0DDG6_AURST|nr:hypothetical protein AURDEDRAFT_186585 [Auricularia subglabra TFB-10046 SS5]
MLSVRTVLAALGLAALRARADLDIYVDGGLSSGWENWSWNTVIDFAATDLFQGLSSISLTSDAWAALSLKLEGTFSQYAGLQFDVAGAPPDAQIYIESTGGGVQSPTIPFSALGNFTANQFKTVLLDFSQLPPSGTPLGNNTWDRISFQAGGNGASYHLDNIKLVSSIVIEPKFLSAEPLASNIIAVTTQGAVDFSSVKVTLNNATVSVSSKITYSPVDAPSKSITYLTLSKTFAPGSLSIAAGGATFSFTIPAVLHGSVTPAVTTPINPHVYGVNFPPSSTYIQHLGTTVGRWGGNAVTAYNPEGDFTNAGNDWYFENRVADEGNADEWLGMVRSGGSAVLLTVPALDWVSKDATSYSYPASVFPNQQAFDPYKPDAGNGKLADGSPVTPSPDPRNAYTSWNASMATNWLKKLKNVPEFVAIDNEIEIAHSTHQDMHPDPISYDEELSRVVTFAAAAKAALPNVKVLAPSTCSWWFYWTSAIGWDDTAAHNNIDFLPWFLQQMKAAEQSAGKRLLDYLDIHYYFQADTSAENAAAKALRLRMTRSLWDPSYVDESWVGSNPQNHQPNPTAVWLIPRMKQLIQQNYPGTKLSISEWSSTNDNDITGGLVTADALGLFGVYGVDAATYWGQSSESGPVGLAYWLFRGFGTTFGDLSVQVNLGGSASTLANTLGFFAAKDSKTGKLSFVIINKDTKPVTLGVSNVPAGNYFARHFGGQAGVAKWQTNLSLKAGDNIVVPSYTALFLKQQ